MGVNTGADPGADPKGPDAGRELAWVPREEVFERPLTGMARKVLRWPILSCV
jgi:hypothetical protein